jgi:GNAT superfamily N-acetyltransferase
MCDHWMPTIKLPLTVEQFEKLPRNSAYRYEYTDGCGHVIPRARHYHALLDLQPMPVTGSVSIERLPAANVLGLVPLFAEAFQSIQPYGSLDEATRLKAAREALERTLTGGDGPWIERASFIARHDKETIGAILITLLPDGDPCEWSSYYWSTPPPLESIELRLGRPHLTWIFVAPLLAGRNVGTALLARAVQELRALGFSDLLSTFMIGNDSSLLWHWRNGFRLLAYPGSLRQLAKPARQV